MSSGITEIDRIDATEPTWHRLETIRKKIAYAGGALDWIVRKLHIYNDDAQPIEGYCRIEDDAGHVLHVTNDTYEIIQNKVLFDIVEESLADVPHEIVTAGSILGRRQVFMSVSIKGQGEKSIGKEKFRDYLTFVTSHNETKRLSYFDTNVRVVCQNTLRAAIASKGEVRASVMHSSKAVDRIEDMKEKLENVFLGRNEYYKQIQRLMNTAVNEDTARQVIAGFVTTGKEYTTNARNETNEIFTRFQRGIGNFGQTRFDLLNGATQWYTRDRMGKKVDNRDWKQFTSSEFGTDAKNKSEFFEALVDEEEFASTRERGKALLAGKN